MSSPIDLKRMRYIVEVAKAEAITSASENLGITQSALSRSIADVEETLGVKLFHRRPRGIELSEQGERFVAQAEQILGNVDDLISGIQATGDEVTGRICLGVTPSSTLIHAHRAIRQLVKEFPLVGVKVVTGSPQTLCPRMLAGDIHLIIGSSYLNRWSELDIISLAELHFACILRKGHPLAQLNSISEVDVLGYPLILPESINPVHSDTAKRYAHHDLDPPKPRYVTDDMDLVLQLISTTDAWFPMMQPSPTFGDLDEHFWVLRDVVEMPTRYLSIAKSSIHTTSIMTERLLNLIISQFPQSR
jgi:DNA-binding transcriptional LysR family regulator